MLGHVRDHPLDGQAEEHPPAPQGWLPLAPEGSLTGSSGYFFSPNSPDLLGVAPYLE
jgi:hypothetical protein